MADEHEKGQSDSGATEHMTSNETAFKHYKSTAPGIMAEIADGTSMQVAGFRKLVISNTKQPSGKMPAMLDRVAQVPKLERNLISTRRASEKSGKFVYHAKRAYLGSDQEECLVFNVSASSGL